MLQIMVIACTALMFANPQGPVKPPDALLKQARERALVEEQKLGQLVHETIRAVARDLDADPDAAVESLRSLLLRVRDHPDIGAEARDRLVQQLQTALRETATRLQRLRVEQAQRQLDEANAAMKVELTVAKAQKVHLTDPKKALKMLRSAALEVWDHPGIREAQRQTLFLRLMEARAVLTGKQIVK
jgi:hypothetical protein